MSNRVWCIENLSTGTICMATSLASVIYGALANRETKHDKLKCHSNVVDRELFNSMQPATEVI